MKYLKLYSVLALLALLGSCTKQLDLTPVSSISDASYWKTADQFDAFVAGIHTAFRNNTSSFEYLGELRADVFGTDPGSSSAFTGEATQGVEHMWLNTLDLDNPGVADFGGFYFNINQINLLLSKLATTTVVTSANKSYYTGAAYGMRAFYYFQLYRSWGKAIIKTDPTTSFDISNLAKAASPEDSVMMLIKSDIAQSLASYGSDYSFRASRSYWSKAATLMLQAEVNLWTSYRGGGTADATVALNALTDIQTNIPSLALLPSFANVFLPANRGNNEIIFSIHNQLNEASLPFANTFLPQTGLLANYYDSVGNRKFNVTTDNWGGLLRAPVKIATYRQFDDKDSRKWNSIQGAYNSSGAVYTIAGCFSNKYQGEQNAGSRVFTNDYPIYRYADLLLMVAEAKAALGQDPSVELNLVRARAFGTNYNPAVQGYPNQPVDTDIHEAVLRERYFEFIFEGKRWYDLRRMGDSYVYEYTNITAASAFMLLWPIDRNTLTNNRLLVQTPGYLQY
jgi:hypothetical protein